MDSNLHEYIAGDNIYETMKTIINGLNINYIDKGQGPMLILLHGWGSNIDLFSGIVNFAKRWARTVASS